MTHRASKPRLGFVARSRRGKLAVVGVLTVGLVMGGAALAYADPEAALLRADVDRDGQLTADDDAGREDWTAERGAVFLPNLDDDKSRCDGGDASDEDLPTCHDAADDVLNGAEDADDLAKLRVEPSEAGADAKATLTADSAAADYVRVFAKRGDGWTTLDENGALTADEIRDGVDLGIEAKDVVRDTEKWDGFVDLTLNIVDGDDTKTDKVRMRVSPLLFVNNTMEMQRAMVADLDAKPAASASDAPSDAGILGGDGPAAEGFGEGEDEFRADLRAGLDQAGVSEPFVEYAVGGDVWTQDVFEPAYMSMPGADGAEHSIRVYVRSANSSRSSGSDDRPLREAGRGVFNQLRGPGVAAIQQYDPDRFGDDAPADDQDTFNSTGNFDAVPPHSHDGRNHPAGRMLYGAQDEFAPDKTFTKMLAAQGYQNPVVLDTSWLLVGHVDEFVSFLPADNERGWIAAVSDPRLGTELLEKLVADGKGDEPLVNGVDDSNVEDPGLTVAEALDKAELNKGQDIAAAGIDRALQTLSDEVGLTDEDVVRLPSLFNWYSDFEEREAVYAYLPGVANGISTGTDVYLAPKQHGPLDGDVDAFEQATQQALSEVGITTTWVEDWEYAHMGFGEIHCVTNAERDLSATTPWWTT
ncbi:MAG: protein-arginine deiminase family protein [Stackebrandtia sp.]